MTTFPHYLTTLDSLPLKNIFVPAELPSKRLMIFLHGRGGKAEDFTWIAERFNFEDMHYLFLNAPDIYDDGYTWYSNVEDIQNASALLTKTFEMLFKRDFDTEKSFLFGFSQGALLTFEFGARHTKKLAGYIAVSGHLDSPVLLLQEMNPVLKNANWLCTHGTQDKALDFNTAKKQIETLQNGGWDITFYHIDKAHVINEEELDLIHEWIQSQLD